MIQNIIAERDVGCNPLAENSECAGEIVAHRFNLLVVCAR